MSLNLIIFSDVCVCDLQFKGTHSVGIYSDICLTANNSEDNHFTMIIISQRLWNIVDNLKTSNLDWLAIHSKQTFSNKKRKVKQAKQ